MPWNANDASRHTKKAGTSSKRKTWARVANGALRKGQSEASAIRIANSVVKKGKRGRKGK